MGRWVNHSEVRNSGWRIWKADGGYTNEAVRDALLLDIREELRNLNHLLGCPNFTNIPKTLRDIRKNTTRRKPARQKKEKAS